MIENNIINTYEVICAFHADSVIFEESKKEFLAKLTSLELELISEEDMGIRTFAYPIKKAYQGHYYVFKIKGKPAKAKEIVPSIKYFDKLYRILVIKNEK